MKSPALLLLPGLFVWLTGTRPAAAESPWRFSAGYAPTIGLRTEFSGFGQLQNPGPLPAPAPATNYFYLDGSVQVDGSGNVGGQTYNFAYQNNSQYDPLAFGGQGAINYTGIAGPVSGGSVKDDNVAAAAGFDLSASLHLGSLAIPAAGGRSATWGLRMRGQYTRVDMTNRDTVAMGLTTINDSFNLRGTIPIAAPYPGSLNGPGPLLDDVPVRTLGTTNAFVSGSRRLDVHIAAMQFGAYVEIPVAKKWDITAETGLILALATGRYDYGSTAAIPGTAPQNSSGSTSRTRFLPGFYIGFGLAHHLTPNLSLQASARYQYMAPFSLSANGSHAAVRFDSAFVLSVSTVWRF